MINSKRITRVLFFFLLIACFMLSVSCNKGANAANQGTASDATKMEAAFKKYDIKSGIIAFSMENDMLKSLGVNMNQIVYFDDYGVKEAKETYRNDKLSTKVMDNGVGFYQLNFDQKKGTKTKSYGNGTEMRFALEQYSDKEIKDHKLQKLPNETIAGKDCAVYSTEDRSLKAKFAGWNHIALLIQSETEVNKKPMIVVIKATKIEENAAIPPAVFELPKDMTITEE
jgi:hypothetical protein